LGHKGKLAMRCEVHGAACHSAYAPQGVNAIEYAARLIGRLGEIGARLALGGHRGGHRLELRELARQRAEAFAIADYRGIGEQAFQFFAP
ncbi:peptidase dimerization domain-containing protein, partial [Acinetobacter baumannii]